MLAANTRPSTPSGMHWTGIQYWTGIHHCMKYWLLAMLAMQGR